MHDMLVRLYDLPPVPAPPPGIAVRRGAASEKGRVAAWVDATFGSVWASEVDVAFTRMPVACFLAVRGSELLGFACRDATCANFFGPTGVIADARGMGVGRALLLETLWDQRRLGYAYSIIGGVDDAAGFYVATVGAVPIEGSTPGIFAHLAR